MHCSLQERKYGWGLQLMKSEGRALAWQRWSLLHTQRDVPLLGGLCRRTRKTQPRTVAGAAPQHASQSHSHTGASQRMLTLGAVTVRAVKQWNRPLWVIKFEFLLLHLMHMHKKWAACSVRLCHQVWDCYCCVLLDVIWKSERLKTLSDFV